MNKLLTALLFAFSLSTAPALAKESGKKPRVVHVCSKNDTPVNVLACNIYHEARGESDKGMLAVGFVTLNRKDHDKFPTTVRKIVYQSSQFSWTLSPKQFKVIEKDSWDKSKEYARLLLRLHTHNKIAYDMLDFTHGSVYFHTTKVRPYWAKLMKKVIRIDNHIFYKEK